MDLPLNSVLLGPCLDLLKTLPDNSVDAVVTDPPYGLGQREPTAEDIVAYLSGGGLDHGGDFMGRDWEIPSVEIWKECLRVLKPGAHLFSFAGCYDDQTEVLTKKGWVRFPDVSGDEMFASLDPGTHKVEWQQAKEVVCQPNPGGMYHYKTSRVDLLVTPNHKMFVAPISTDAFQLVRADEHNRAIRMTKTSKGRSDATDPGVFRLPSVLQTTSHGRQVKLPEKSIPLDAWIPFFGLYLAEGSASTTKNKPRSGHERGCGYQVSLSHFNIDNLQEIQRLLANYFEVKIYPKLGKLRINSKQLVVYLKQFGYAWDKHIPAWVKQLPKERLSILLDWYLRGDGCRQRTAYTTSARLRDDWQEIAMYMGMSADWVLDKPRDNPPKIDGREIHSRRPSYTIGFHRTQTKPQVYSSSLPVRSAVSSEEWGGRNVYCVELERHHTLYVRRNGKAVWCGNTRTWDLMSVGIRAAGFDNRDTIASQFGVSALQWLHGCLSADSEILTEQGWVGVNGLREGLSVAMWEPETEEIRLGSVSEVTCIPYRGPMVRFCNDNTDQLVTPNHRVFKKHVVRKQVAGVRRRWFEEEWSALEAVEINRWQPFKLPLAGYQVGPGIGGRDYAALLGWVWTEGGFDQVGTGVRLYQSDVNPEHVVEIERLVSVYAPGFKHYQRERVYKGREYVEHTWYFSGEPASRIRESLPGKHPTFDLLWSMDMEEKRAFIHAALCGDGTIEQLQFYQKDNADREWFQTLVHMVGWQARDNERKRCVSLHANPITEMHSRCLQAHTLESYEGDVWCVRVETGAFVARRNGRIFITGNSGFPKSLNVKKAMLKAGVDPSIANQYEGLGTALKPAWEPILVFRKPLEGTVVDNVLEHGTGALNIDGARVGGKPRTTHKAGNFPNPHSRETAVYGQFKVGVEADTPTGRWPANVILTHSEGCKVTGSKKVDAPVINQFDDGMKPFGDGAGHAYTSEQTGDENGQESVDVYECVEGCPVKILDEQSGEVSGAYRSKVAANSKMLEQKPAQGEGHSVYSDGLDTGGMGPLYADSGGASRFFPQFEAPFFYTGKASKKEKNQGLDKFVPGFFVVRPDLTDEEVDLLSVAWTDDLPTYDQPVLEGHIPAELMDDSEEGRRKLFVPAKPNDASHPTVKPVSLMRWLIRLACPEGGVVVDPYCGSGTTCVAAVEEGRQYIGMERDPAFHKLAAKRIEHVAREIGELREQQAATAMMEELPQE